jgi:hypothetical protein
MTAMPINKLCQVNGLFVLSMKAPQKIEGVKQRGKTEAKANQNRLDSTTHSLTPPSFNCLLTV